MFRDQKERARSKFFQETRKWKIDALFAYINAQQDGRFSSESIYFSNRLTVMV